MNLILHITQRQQWEAAQAHGAYRCDSLDTEGFIHCSTPSQVVRVANFFYAGQQGLVLLWIDGDRLQAELRYDAIDTGETFPHVYGEVNLDAVMKVTDFEPEADGTFKMPNSPF